MCDSCCNFCEIMTSLQYINGVKQNICKPMFTSDSTSLMQIHKLTKSKLNNKNWIYSKYGMPKYRVYWNNQLSAINILQENFDDTFFENTG